MYNEFNLNEFTILQLLFYTVRKTEKFLCYVVFIYFILFFFMAGVALDLISTLFGSETRK